MIRLLLKWFAIGSGASLLLFCVYFALMAAKAHRQASGADAFGVSFSVGWLILWILIGGGGCAIAAFWIKTIK